MFPFPDPDSEILCKMECYFVDMNNFKIYLKNNVDKDDKERISQVEEEPHLHRFDGGGAGQGGGDRQVDGGQHHHARNVHSDNQVVLAVSSDVVGQLVDDVHQDGGQVCHHEDACNFIPDVNT